MLDLIMRWIKILIEMRPILMGSILSMWKIITSHDQNVLSNVFFNLFINIIININININIIIITIIFTNILIIILTSVLIIVKLVDKSIRFTKIDNAFK